MHGAGILFDHDHRIHDGIRRNLREKIQVSCAYVCQSNTYESWRGAHDCAHPQVWSNRPYRQFWRVAPFFPRLEFSVRLHCGWWGSAATFHIPLNVCMTTTFYFNESKNANSRFVSVTIFAFSWSRVGCAPAAVHHCGTHSSYQRNKWYAN